MTDTFYRMTPMEIALGWVFGQVEAPPRPERVFGSAREALEDVMRFEPSGHALALDGARVAAEQVAGLNEAADQVLGVDDERLAR